MATLPGPESFDRGGQRAVSLPSLLSSPSYSPPESPSPTRPLPPTATATATTHQPYPPHVPSPRFANDFVGLGLWSEGDSSRPVTPGGEDWVRRPTPPSPPRFGHSPHGSDRDYGDDEDEDDHDHGEPYTPLSASSVDLDAGPEPDIFSVHLKPRDRLSSSSSTSSRQSSYARPKEKYGPTDSIAPPRRGGLRDASSDAEIPLLPVSQQQLHQPPPPKEGYAGETMARRRRKCLTYSILFVGLFGIAAALANAVRQHRVQWGSDSGFRGVDLAANQVDVEEKSWSRGGDGDTVTTETGATFVYTNQFGGTWDSSPRGMGARAQSFTPALSERWDYAKNAIAGVNIGGWLNLEPFITPYIYEPFLDWDTPAIDEWTLSINLGDRLAEVVEEHYNTFITEEDFAEIARAGLNWVRIPLPYWALETAEGEPFLAHVAWKYFLKAMQWARKYGLRINLDLHTAPGSQNGWNHSGKTGSVGFMNGVMGVANAQRCLNHIRVLAEFLSIPENAEVVPMFGILNEPQVWVMGDESLRSFYLEAYETVRNASGLGEGHGPMISIHDSFQGPSLWTDFLKGADRLALDQHLYLAFREPNTLSLRQSALMPCAKWAAKTNMTLATFGLTTAGEFSVAVNDCGKFLNGVNLGVRFEGTYPHARNPSFAGVGSCKEWDDYRGWDDEMKEDLKDIALANMDAMRNWFYWTWKTGISLTTNRTTNPLWNYSLGVREGFLPADPRQSQGFCLSNNERQKAKPIHSYHWNGALQAYQTGGPGAGTIEPTELAKYGTFPPATLTKGLVASLLPTYTQTGTPVVLNGLAATATPTTMGEAKGWFVPVEGCEYPGPWDGVKASVPTAACTGL
ncbi:hypothetical protein RQP46_004932 [Phenoliferia psychrophenolica]